MCTITSWTLNPSVRSSNRSEKIGDCLAFFPKLRGYGQVKQPDFCGRSTTEPVLSAEGWNTRCRPRLIRRDWVPTEVRDWGGAGYWPCPRLAPRRLTGDRLRRVASGGSWCGMRWFLSRKVGDLITGTCGLGGPHYGLIGYAMLPVIGPNR